MIFMMYHVINLLAYLIGSVPTGYWFALYFFGVDITKYGSGNIGATNISRILGMRYFLLIFTFDALKATLFLLFCSDYFHLSNSHLVFLSIMLLVGNAYSPFLRWQGGKGVATTIGILIALTPWHIALFFPLLWLLIIAITKRADLASLFCIVSTTIYSYLSITYINQDLLALFVFMTFWLFWTHRNNLKNSLVSKSL
jgi:glycerol-3-phosphate acyltransferase PlsY